MSEQLTPTQRVKANRIAALEASQDVVDFDFALELAAELEAKTKECEELRNESKACYEDHCQLRQQVEELKREVNDVRQILTLADEERDQLKARAEKAEQDSARLDWFLGKSLDQALYVLIDHGDGKSLRQAIDEARE